MAEHGTLGFVIWITISVLTIMSLLVTIRNGLGVDDAVVGGAAGISFWQAIKNFFRGGSRVPAPVQRRSLRPITGSGWWK